MTEPESHHERELGGQLLASVSRSFYLTLKALPAELREPISLAYLLARTADTIADTAEAPAALRLECL
ncbi:MAG: squalene/phytoene synthase family protein, partial [Prosthecobacter sp.]|nr:squalene/phytoene synthase family protein [Prosthecobacter sp.]